MAYTVLDSNGNTVTLELGDKITTEGRDLIISGIGPYAQGGRRKYRLIAPAIVSFSAFAQINNSTLVPEYSSAVSIALQLKEAKEEKDNLVDDNALWPTTYKVAYAKEAGSQNYSLIRLVLRDAVHGLTFPSLYTVKLVPRISTGGDTDLGTPSTTTDGTLRTLNPVYVSIWEQITLDGNERIKRGDAKIVIPRHAATEAELMGNTLIEITPKGSSSLRYRIWPGKGIETEQTFHWCIYLERIRP